MQHPKPRISSRRRFTALALAPALTMLVALSLPPTIGTAGLAFRNDSLLSSTSRWIGFGNFARMWSDPRFFNSLEVSLIWEIVTVSGAMILAILLGGLLYERVRGGLRAIVCVALIVPIILPRVSVGLIWRFMYSPLMGIINYPFQLAALQPIEFLTRPAVALYAVAVVDIWQWSLFFAVIVLKLLESLPAAPLEAARLDGATAWQVHWSVSLPMLRMPLVTMAFVKAIESLRSFDLIYTMTAGGPGIATETLDLYVYQQAFAISGQISYAAAMSLLLLAASSVAFALIWTLMQRWSR
jgi:multiple sugar transport system permease protein